MKLKFTKIVSAYCSAEVNSDSMDHILACTVFTKEQLHGKKSILRLQGYEGEAGYSQSLGTFSDGAAYHCMTFALRILRKLQRNDKEMEFSPMDPVLKGSKFYFQK